MSQEFKVEIISPDKTIYSGESSEAVLPCYEGQVTILKDHIPLITFLRPGLIKIKNQKDKTFFVDEGTVEFVDNNLLILTSTARDLSKLDNKLVESLINEAEKKIKDVGVTDKQKYLLSYKISSLKNINQ